MASIISKETALHYMSKAISDCPEASNSNLITLAGNMANAWPSGYQPEVWTKNRKRLRWALIVTKAAVQ